MLEYFWEVCVFENPPITHRPMDLSGDIRVFEKAFS